MKKQQILIKLIFPILLLSALVFTACTDDKEININPVQEEIKGFKISPEEACSELEDFLNARNRSWTTRGTMRQRTIADVQPIALKAVKTRAINTEDELEDFQLDTLMYSINFSNDQGFAIMSADRRTEPILAITDEGSFNINDIPSDGNEGFLNFLSLAVEYIYNEIQTYQPTIETRASRNGWEILEEYEPRLQVKWGQGAPYNKYCPNNYPTGCTVTAVAQIMSYFQDFYFPWGQFSTYLHWSHILDECNSYNGQVIANSESADEVAKLMAFLGEQFEADYGQNETSVSKNKPIDWMRKWRQGWQVSKLHDYNSSDIINNLKMDGRLIYTRGNTGRKKFIITFSHTGGHAWVMDGLIAGKKDGNSRYLVHCNWGWEGDSNGYYLNNVFNITSGEEILDSVSNVEANFKYNTQYSTIHL